MISLRKTTLSLVLSAAAVAAGCAPHPHFIAEGWPSADRLFHSDPRWRGGDAAYSIGLEKGRVLWLFGDTFIKKSGAGGRAGSVMVRNSVGLQEGLDPSRAKMRFYWGEGGGRAGDFFASAPGEWLWPGHGARVGRGLLIFMVRVRAKGDGVFGFEPFGWTVFIVENPDAPPELWSPRRLDAPTGGPGLCSGAVLEWEGHVYAYCPSEPAHLVYLARWNAARVEAGDLAAPRWWAGNGWEDEDKAVPVFAEGQTELTVHYDDRLRSFVEVQTAGLKHAELVLRFAPRPEGLWSKPSTVFRPAQSVRTDAFVYAAKAHPALSGPDLALTYASNAWDFGLLTADESLYYPRFVRLRRETGAKAR